MIEGYLDVRHDLRKLTGIMILLNVDKFSSENSTTAALQVLKSTIVNSDCGSNL